jgi:hypothetical protein
MTLILLAAVGSATGAAIGCSSGTSCGPGTHAESDLCVASEQGGSSTTSTTSTRGQGGGASTTTTTTTTGTSSGGGGGSNAGAPTFAGAKAISPATETSVVVNWDAASDASTPASDLRYAVYLSATPGDEHYGSPDAIVPHGGTSYLATDLPAGAKAYAVVRAIDADGNQDGNTVERSGTPQNDTTPPTFGGATGAASKPGGKVEVSWSAASDDLSSAGAISYGVWASATTPVDTTGAPTVSTAAGATLVDLVLPTPGQDYHFVVGARDAAGNTTVNPHEVDAMPGADTQPPTFGGCTAAVASDAVSVDVTWDAASDDTTPVDQISYTIYAFTSPGPHTDLTAAVSQATFVGTPGGTVTGLAQHTQFFLDCRAKDLTGNQDGNHAEKTATTPTDTTAPAFSGLQAVVQGMPSTTSVDLTWNAGSDTQTPTDKLRYDIFQATTSMAEDYGTPTMTVTGVTQASVTVQSATQLFFVVRARDAAGNSDANTTELSVTSDVSFEGDIQPILSGICITCHSIVVGTATPYYDDGQAYANIRNSPHPIAVPFDSADSYLYTYTAWSGTTCPFMPFNDCPDRLLPSQFGLIKDWIDQGAVDN